MKKYTITVRIEDNETKANGDIIIHGDNPKEITSGVEKLLNASIQLINLSPAELKEVAYMTQELINKKKNL